MNANNDPELTDWLFGILHHRPTRPGSFLERLALAASTADYENYALLRPVLLKLKNKYPEYRYDQSKNRTAEPSR